VKKNKTRFTAEELSSILDYDTATIEKMIESINAHPDWSEEDIAEELLYKVDL